MADGMMYGQAEIPGMGSYAPGGPNAGKVPPETSWKHEEGFWGPGVGADDGGGRFPSGGGQGGQDQIVRLLLALLGKGGAGGGGSDGLAALLGGMGGKRSDMPGRDPSGGGMGDRPRGPAGPISGAGPVPQSFGGRWSAAAGGMNRNPYTRGSDDPRPDALPGLSLGDLARGGR